MQATALKELPLSGSLQHFRSRFLHLPPAVPREGDYDSALAGPLWLRSIGPPGLALLGLPGWCGKRFLAAGEGINLLKGRKGIRPALPFRWEHGPSAIDGREALLIRYPADARWPWPGVTDELRQWEPGLWLGMTYARKPSSLAGPLPFLLHHPHELHSPHGRVAP